MARLARARIPIFRGDVKERCAQIVRGTFISIQSPGTIIDAVKKQLSQYNYTCPTATAIGVKGIPMRSKPYRNDRIVTVLRAVFFTGGSSSYAHRYAHKFPLFTSTDGVAMRGVPKPMVALVATALYAALREWRTGTHQVTDFSADTYADAYKGHIGSLDYIEANRPNAYLITMTHLYTLANSTVEDAPVPSFADIDLDELDE
jgi:hypothetical protein